ncbi:MAG: TetR/AcrR family transcriptional regulator [Anaerolineae bacterium]|nr:TetR/AcrR family transcriptional regulator [Anaerolineae bacterium]
MIETEARERVLNVAERLFSERGYAAVTLRDIADALGIKQASLYYHVPQGKQALFAEVTERGLHRHQHGLEQSISAAAATAGSAIGEQMRAQLNAAAHWLLSQPPLNLSRMTTSDMPELDQEVARQLEQTAYQSLMIPLANIFRQAAHSGKLRRDAAGVAPELMAGTLLASVESLRHLREEYFTRGASTRESQVAQLIDVFIYGLVDQHQE